MAEKEANTSTKPMKIMHHIGGKVTMRKHLAKADSSSKIKKIFDNRLFCKDFIDTTCNDTNCKLLHKKNMCIFGCM